MDELRAKIVVEQEASRALEPTPTERDAWQSGLLHAVNGFFAELDSLPTLSLQHDASLADFAAATSDASSVEELLAAVTRGVATSGILTSGPGHLGFIPGGGLYLGAIADHLGAALNPFSADAFAAPVAVAIHDEALRWLCDVVGYGPDSYGDLTSGGSHATLAALVAARRATGIRSRDIPNLVVYAGEHTHHCCAKALEALFGPEIQLRQVGTHRHAMDVKALADAVAADEAAGLRPWLIVATAGSTNLGQVDPLEEIAEVAARFGLWLHVDAAYGGFFALLPELEGKFRGLSAADSIVLDPHKGLFLPYGTGAVVLKNGAHLRQETTGSYLQDRDGVRAHLRSPMDHSLELTRPFRALRLWLAQKVYGRRVFTAALREKRLLALYCAERLRAMARLELVAEPDLSIVAFRCSDGDDATQVLLERVNAQSGAFLSSSRIDGRMVIRIAILSFRTHLPTVEGLLATIAHECSKALDSGDLS